MAQSPHNAGSPHPLAPLQLQALHSPSVHSPRSIAPSPSGATPTNFTFPMTPNTMQHGFAHITPYGANTAMGPPSALPQKPGDKKEESGDFADILLSTGIDIRGEEEALTAEFFSQSRSQGGYSQGQSFRSDPTYTPPPGSSFSSANASSGLLRNAPPGGYGNGVNQSSFHSPDDLARQQESAARRRLAESQSYHVNNPFLNLSLVKQKIVANLQQSNIRINNNGDTLTAGEPRYSATSATTPGGYGVTAVHGHNYFNDTSMADILALISLATSDHLRGLAESAVAFAIGRQTTSHGEVPLEFSDIAIPPETALANGVNEDVAMTDMPADVQSRKRSFSAMENGTNGANSVKPAATSLPYSEAVSKALYAAARAEFDAEEARVARRAARAAANLASSSTTASNPSTPVATAGLVAPDVDSKKKVTKEQRKQAESKANEASLHLSTNKTANFLLSGALGGKKKKQYSWMNVGGPAAASSPSTPGAGAMTSQELSGAIPGSFEAAKVVKLGDWREDGERGLGIQLRDWIAAFEADGREKTSLGRAYAKLR